MGNYFDLDLIKKDYILMEYVFDGRPDQIIGGKNWIANNRVKNNLKPFPGKNRDSGKGMKNDPHGSHAGGAGHGGHHRILKNRLPGESSASFGGLDYLKKGQSPQGREEGSLDEDRDQEDSPLFKSVNLVDEDLNDKLNGKIVLGAQQKEHKKGSKNGVHYSKKGGIEIKKHTHILIDGSLAPKGNDIAKTMCFYFEFYYHPKIGDLVLLFQRGDPLLKHSLQVFLKFNGESRHLLLRVNYENVFKNKTIKRVDYQAKTLVMNEKGPNEAIACLATATNASLTSAVLYVNGKSEVFENRFGLVFDWGVYSRKNVLFSKDSVYSGTLVLRIFTAFQGAGGLIYSREKHTLVNRFLFR